MEVANHAHSHPPPPKRALANIPSAKHPLPSIEIMTNRFRSHKMLKCLSVVFETFACCRDEAGIN